MTGESRITILAPGVVSGCPLPKRWRKRGRFQALPPLAETELLARAFGIDPAGLAAAPLHYLGMTGSEPEGYCLFAYPVYLHARREQLVLMTGDEFELSEVEAAAILDTLREHYPHWRLERTGDAMWFIITDEDPDIETSPLHEALGEDINDHLPRGKDALAWTTIMNELQMILFDTEVNRQREAAGRPPVNSLWFWGGGWLPDLTVSGWRRLVSNDPVALGIGRRAGLDTRRLEGAPAAGGAGVEITEADTLWVCSAAGREEDGGGTIVAERQWAALGEALRGGEVDELVLIEPGHGELRIESRHTRSWLPWR